MSLSEQVERLNSLMPYSDYNSINFEILMAIAKRIEELERLVGSPVYWEKSE